jgi:hypothetical protein
MKTKVFYLFMITLLLCSCQGNMYRTMGFKVDRGFSTDFSLGHYAASCWTLSMKDQNIKFEIDSNWTFKLPTRSQEGFVNNIIADGKYTTKLKIRVSPLLLAGTPPPACALAPPIDGPNIATTVVTFKIKANYIIIWGDEYIHNNVRHENILISKSDIEIIEFDIHNVWDAADTEIKKATKKIIKRQIDKEVSHYINNMVCLGCNAPRDLPVYIPGYNPYN